MNVNVFNRVTSPRVLSYRYVLHYFLTIPVGFNFNLTYGLKPQVGGIKIVTVYKRSIFIPIYFLRAVDKNLSLLESLGVLFEQPTTAHSTILEPMLSSRD